MYSFLIYGPAGIGKTTLASKLEKVLLLDFERGAKFIKGCEKRSVNDLDGFRALLKELKVGEYRTVVIDSLTALEKLIHKDILARSGAKNMATAMGGYGAAYKEAVAMFSAIHDTLDRAFQNVIYIGHVAQKTVANPFGDNYEQATVLLDARLQDFVHTVLDGVYYYTYALNVDDGKIEGKAKRLIVTKDTPQCLCKDRLELAQTVQPEELIAAINTLK